MNLSDQEVVRKVVKGCSSGDKKYQEELYKQLYSKMLTVCYRYTDNSEDAKDLFQEGFIKVFEKIGKFNFKGSLEGWIRRIMVNNAIDHYRKHKKRFVMSDTLLQVERIANEEIEDGIFDELTVNDLLAFVQKLSPVYRTVFNLYVIDDYSHAEISDELGISEGTSKSNLSKAKKNLKYMILQNIKNEKK